MKLIQLNTWSCKLPTEIVRLFEQEKPDIVCMQEVISTERGGKIIDTIEDITTSYPFINNFYTPLVNFSFMHHRAKRGNMIASQLPITATNELWTHGAYIEDFDYVNSGGYNAARNIAHAQIDTPQGPLHVLTLHGYHIAGHKNGNDETLRACQELVDYAASLDGPIIITGDFNLTPNSESIQLINKTFRNLTTEYGLTTTRNHLTPKTEACDYIFVSDKVSVATMYPSDTIASDHSALVLEFNLETTHS